MKTYYELKLAVVVDRVDEGEQSRQVRPHAQPVAISLPVKVDDPKRIDAEIEKLCKSHSDLPKYKKVKDEVRPEKTV